MKSPYSEAMALLSITILTACGNKDANFNSSGNPLVQSAPITAENSATSMEVDPASSSECANGGSIIRLFKDLNANGIYDPSIDTLVSASPVCNGAAGATGAQGVGAGIKLAAAPSGTCPAGGTMISTFQDLNNNGILDGLESITSTSTVCNGVAGANGANGTNGSSAFITSTAATSAQCAAGGVVYATHVDGQASQTNIVCNGVNGSNGSDGSSYAMGAIGQAVPGKVYSACHHDYLYLPDNSGGNRGWLTFRHQANGSADQGIGSTGFNVWNVDITDFNLVSEDLSVVYCQVHWDANKRQMNFTVIDRSDGLAGQTGMIQVGTSVQNNSMQPPL